MTMLISEVQRMEHGRDWSETAPLPDNLWCVANQQVLSILSVSAVRNGCDVT